MRHNCQEFNDIYEIEAWIICPTNFLFQIASSFLFRSSASLSTILMQNSAANMSFTAVSQLKLTSYVSMIDSTDIKSPSAARTLTAFASLHILSLNSRVTLSLTLSSSLRSLFPSSWADGIKVVECFDDISEPWSLERSIGVWESLDFPDSEGAAIHTYPLQPRIKSTPYCFKWWKCCLRRLIR